MAEAKLTTEKVKVLFWHFEVPRWRSRAEEHKGVWMIRRLEQKISASGLLQSSFYIVNIKDNHLLTEKKTNKKVIDIEFIFIA